MNFELSTYKLKNSSTKKLQAINLSTCQLVN
nr:MAG TPA: Transcription factor DP1, Transcription factor factor, cell-cycle regulation, TRANSCRIPTION.9A [Caudoviricetes sp.]